MFPTREPTTISPIFKFNVAIKTPQIREMQKNRSLIICQSDLISEKLKRKIEQVEVYAVVTNDDIHQLE